ncbi:unnamed protein product, partial [Polarella glacialis]
ERVPTEDEVNEYAEYLGIDLETEQPLMWIAKEGVIAPVPSPWKACTENGDDVFYFNFESGESIWDHPCDERYRQMVEDARAGKEHANGCCSDKSCSSSKPEVEATSGKEGEENEADSSLQSSDSPVQRKGDADAAADPDVSFSAASVASVNSKCGGGSASGASPGSASIVEQSISLLSSPKALEIQVNNQVGGDSPAGTAGSKAAAGQSPGALVTSFSALVDESFSVASLDSASSPQGKSAASMSSPANGSKNRSNISLSAEDDSCLSPPLPSLHGSPLASRIGMNESAVVATPEKGLAGVGLAGALGFSPATSSAPVLQKSSGSASGRSGRSRGSAEGDEIEEESYLDGSASMESASQSGAPSHSGGPGGGLPRPAAAGTHPLLAHPQLDHSGPLGYSGGSGKSAS